MRSSGSTRIFSEALFVCFGPLNNGKAHCPASFNENRRNFLRRIGWVYLEEAQVSTPVATYCPDPSCIRTPWRNKWLSARYLSKRTRSRSSPRLTINRINPPSILKKQRDWRAQSKQPKILVRFDVPKIKPAITEPDWDGLGPDANLLHILSPTRDVTDDQAALST